MLAHWNVGLIPNVSHSDPCSSGGGEYDCRNNPGIRPSPGAPFRCAHRASASPEGEALAKVNLPGPIRQIPYCGARRKCHTLTIVFGLILTLALLSGPATPEDFANRNNEALALISFPWQQLHYNIVFLAPKDGVRAMIFPADRRIEVYARPSDDSRLLAYDIAHELGHAIDITFNTAKPASNGWQPGASIRHTPWFGCNRCSDFKTPAGDFAETFAFLLLGPGNFSGRIASAPTAEQIPILKAFFASELEPAPVNPSDGVEAKAGAAKVLVESPVLAKK